MGREQAGVFKPAGGELRLQAWGGRIPTHCYKWNDCAAPKVPMKKRTTVKVNAMSLAILIKLLAEGTRTCAELAADTGLHVLTVYLWTRELHKQKVIHIVAWEADTRGRAVTKVFMLGAGQDAKRNKDPATVRTARYREKLRQIEMSGWVMGAQAAHQAAAPTA